MNIGVGVEDADVPLLLGFNDLKKKHLLLNYIDNLLEFVSQETSFPVKY